jgi:hypothetical protein
MSSSTKPSLCFDDPCRHFLLGCCNKGSGCRFKHDKGCDEDRKKVTAEVITEPKDKNQEQSLSASSDQVRGGDSGKGGL